MSREELSDAAEIIKSWGGDSLEALDIDEAYSQMEEQSEHGQVSFDDFVQWAIRWNIDSESDEEIDDDENEGDERDSQAGEEVDESNDESND